MHRFAVANEGIHPFRPTDCPSAQQTSHHLT